MSIVRPIDPGNFTERGTNLRQRSISNDKRIREKNLHLSGAIAKKVSAEHILLRIIAIIPFWKIIIRPEYVVEMYNNTCSKPR